MSYGSVCSMLSSSLSPSPSPSRLCGTGTPDLLQPKYSQIKKKDFGLNSNINKAWRCILRGCQRLEQDICSFLNYSHNSSNHFIILTFSLGPYLASSSPCDSMGQISRQLISELNASIHAHRTCQLQKEGKTANTV